MDTKEELVKEVHEGRPVYRTMEVKQKIVDDNTDQIANSFRNWLASA